MTTNKNKMSIEECINIIKYVFIPEVNSELAYHTKEYEKLSETQNIFAPYHRGYITCLEKQRKTYEKMINSFEGNSHLNKYL